MHMTHRSEKGASAILIASSMILLLGFAAIAVDAGAGMGQRRQNQTAADVAAMAGAVESLKGGTAVVAKVLEYAQKNIPGVPAGSWQAMWQGCVDPAAERNTQAGDNFVALAAPAGWVVAQPANWCISFDSAKGLLRVRIPNQTTTAEFGKAIGTGTLTTKAAAVSQLVTRDLGGVLPFGLNSAASGGDHLCVSDSPAGLAVPPCDGGNSGNFGVLKARQFGNLFLGTDQNCTVSPLNQVLAQNIAIGYDHIIVTDLDGLPANEVRDVCTNPFVDTLEVDPGFPNNGTEWGLVGPVPPTSTLNPTARLRKVGPFYSPLIFGNKQINDTPLWTYLLAQGAGPDYNGSTGSTADDAPPLCDPAGFAPGPATVDYDGDGTLDNPNSSQHMERCLQDYVSSASAVIIFSETILANNSRFAYVPQFWELSMGPGWKHIQRFRAVYLNATVWRRAGADAFHTPGENCVGCTGPGSWALKGLTAFVFPDASLPPILRGDPPPGSLGLQPFDVFLAR